MAVLSLPLTFSNSFWSQDYHRGVETLFGKLEQGVAENDEIITFIRARASAESYLTSNLMTPAPTGKPTTGFNADDGASLLMAFRGLQAESVTQGQAHNSIAKELTTLVADPFDRWAQAYKARLRQTKTTVVDNWLRSYEQAQVDVSKLKHQYLAKTRRADEAEDDAKFAPNNDGPIDKFTNSPRVRPADRAPVQRTASVSERIAQRLKEIQKKGIATTTSEDDSNTSPESSSEKPLTKVDKGKGKEIELESPPPISPMPAPVQLPSSPTPPLAPETIILAGLSLPPAAISGLLARAAAELPLRPVRFPLIGEYQDTFTGEEFVTWLKENVHSLGGSLDRAEDMARVLTEREGLLRRLGEFGNQFEGSDDAYYQFRPKAFELEKSTSEAQLSPRLQPENLLKRTGNLVNLVSKALNNSANSEPGYIRARSDADEADKAYRIGVRKLDRQRLALEERIEDTLKLLQHMETERLRAVKTVLLQYQGTLANLPKSMEPSMERSGTLISAYQPESDLTALIERYRTGPFRPDPQVYESVAHDESDVVFGIDLRKWAEGGWYALTQGEAKKDAIPPVLIVLLHGLDEAYERLPNDIEKRKAWIYDVPLPAVHHLRESLNAIPPNQPFPTDLIAKFDAPVIASCIKLWALELNPPLALYEGWEDFRKLYPSVGASASKEGDEGKEHLQQVATSLQKLPRVHILVLDAIVKHLKDLVQSTKVDETDEVYFTKLALSLGRTILRPKFESEISIQDRHPTSLFLDLLRHYDVLLPPTLAQKKSERKVPVRKRTAPVDMRLSRSRISMGADARVLLAAQQIAQNPSLAPKSVKSPELPSLPLLPPPVPAVVSEPQQPKAAAPPLVPPPPPPAVVSKPITPPPRPAVAASFTPPPPPPPVITSEDRGLPRPTFKDPAPEFDDLPPRPSFKEPPPESDDLPTRPTFTDPAPENDIPATLTPPPPPPLTSVIPPTPQKRASIHSTPSKIASRSPSPPDNGDIVLGTGKTTISRAGSAQSAPRGTRTTRGPRPGGSSSVQNMVQNLNRTSVSGSPPNSASVTPTSPKLNRLSGSPVKRPSSVVGRSAAAFSRRTMVSDAEDEIVDKK
ncbi:hypothetical protein BYT27DRAFT_7199108 [Phlegmacium glaucopus]|nr:hypothetical protein BYT27DRAFT_7199108 [Phlegmacium glaucopus]